MSVYKVTRQTSYRDHEPGSTFPAELEHDVERRALERGDIKVIHRGPVRLEAKRASPPRDWPLKT